MSVSNSKKQKSNYRKTNAIFVIFALILSLIVILLLSFNVIRIALKKSNAAGATLKTETKKELTNQYYQIGNNPTVIEKEYFNELTQAVNDNDWSQDKMFAYASAVVKSFISDFYTWTNKDGNYEVGGLQYIFNEKYLQFQEEMRYGFYSDLDLYISQYGRENLLEVTSVTIENPRFGKSYTVNGKDYDSFWVDAAWEYKNSNKVDVNEFQHKARFLVINNNGRFEIATIEDRMS